MPPPKPWERAAIGTTFSSTPPAEVSGHSAHPTSTHSSPAQPTADAHPRARPSWAATSPPGRYGVGGGRYASAHGGAAYQNGMYGSGMYGGAYGNGLYAGGGMGSFMGMGMGMGGMGVGMGFDPDKDPMPPGLRHLENLMFSSTRILQVIEMNFEVLQHFLGSMMALFERLRAIYNDTRQLTSSVGRHSLEFGESSLSTARVAKSRVWRYPLSSLGLVCFCLMLLQRRYRGRVTRPMSAGDRSPSSLTDAFAKSVLDVAWSVHSARNS
ncbi:hypothetical protein AB1Y20_014212 [Prymnesium parvum]|uniref:Peroxin-13 n=1 Tax=Prymnesium parvum TaxID=97485 RepID=A0AB34IH18_PRYPA